MQYSYVDKTATQTTPLVKSVKYDYANNSGTRRDYLYGYEYDNIGNITRAYYETAGSTATGSTKEVGNYLYDEQNQLEYEEVYGDSYPYTLLYTYDTYGNIREVFKASGIGYDSTSEVWQYGSPKKIESYRYADDQGWADLLTEYNGNTLRYDGIGNPITYYSPKRNENCTMSWNGRTLLGMTAGSDKISYSYDADGQRTGKKVGSKNYTYVYYGNRLVEYVCGGWYEMHFLYDETGSAMGFTYKSADHTGTYYYVLNGQGDVVQLRDSEQEVVANYHYDAWGRLLSITDADGKKITNTSSIAYQNPIRYRGYVYDEETGFYYLNSRYYDPQIRRFINVDCYISTGQGFIGYNMFAYCGNNQVNHVDATGQLWVSINIANAACGGVIMGSPLPRVLKGKTPRPLEPIPRSSVPMTDYEKEVQLAVAQTIYGEAGGSESYSDWKQGQEAVAWTIINRIESPVWPNDAISVVLQPNQYIGYAGGKSRYENGTCNAEMWDYAFLLGKSIAIGDYAAIPYPKAWGDNKYMGFYASKNNPDNIGGNVFR